VSAGALTNVPLYGFVVAHTIFVPFLCHWKVDPIGNVPVAFNATEVPTHATIGLAVGIFTVGDVTGLTFTMTFGDVCTAGVR
jgi:hypothetical protein